MSNNELPVFLVTGSNGFVGQHFVNYLKKNDLPYLRLVRNVADSDSNEIGMMDIASNNIDIVVHLAGRAHILAESAADPEAEFKKANIDFALSVARAAVLAGVKRFVFVSTVGVYGKYSCDKPITERTPVLPAEIYARTKLEAERQLQIFCTEQNLELVILRPALVYGDNAPGNLAKFYRLCQTSWPLPLLKAVNLRTMLEVNSLCRALHLCSVEKAAANRVYNVADSAGISTSSLATCFKSGMQKSDWQFAVPLTIFKFFFLVFNKDKMYKQLFEGFYLDSSSLQEELGWAPCSEPASVLKSIKIEEHISNAKN